MRLCNTGATAKSISILRPPLLITGSCLIGLSAVTAVWSVTAKIPDQVYGVGVLQQAQSTYDVSAPSSGSVAFPFVRKGKRLAFSPPKWSQESYRFLKSPELFSDDQVISLARTIADDAYSFSTYYPRNLYQYDGSANTGGAFTPTIEEGTIIALIDNPSVREKLMSSIVKLANTQDLYKQLTQLNKQSLEQQQSLYEAKQSILAPMRELVRKGYSSKVELLNQRSDALNQRNQLISTQEQLKQTKIKMLEDNISLRDSLSSYIASTFVFGYQKAQINAFRVSQWAAVQGGSPLLQLKWLSHNNNVVIPVAIDQVVATQVGIGMKAIVTPLGFNPAEIGGIEGKIVGIESDPMTINLLSQNLNSTGLATLLSDKGAVYLIYVSLEREDAIHLESLQKRTSQYSLGTHPQTNMSTNNRGGFVWNNRSQPPIMPREGFLLSAKITTRHRTPIAMLIPSIKEFVGLQTPHKFELLEEGQPAK